MFALISNDGNYALMSTGAAFVYSTRATAKLAARILGKTHRTTYKVVAA